MSANKALVNRKITSNNLEYWRFKEPPSIAELLERRRKPEAPSWLLDFGTPQDIDIYNSSAPIWDGRRWLIAVREEAGDEFSSQIRFFSHFLNNQFHREDDVSNLGELSMGKVCQDPAGARIRGNVVIVQVEIDPVSLNDNSQDTRLMSAIYAGKDLLNLSLIAKSPNKMKGVRLVDLKERGIGIFTRPQSPGNPAAGGRGKIGFTVVDSLDQITTDVLAGAPLIPDLYSAADEEWRGVNHVQLLPNGDLAVLDHVARFEPSEIENSKGYYPDFFTFNPMTLQVDNQQILATVADFRLNDRVRPKKPELENVTYPSALLFPNNDIASNYAVYMGGIRDSKMVAIRIPNPLNGWLAARRHEKYALSLVA